MRTLKTILCAAFAGAGFLVRADAPKADYAADAENIRAYREATLAIADFKLREVDDALAKEDPIEGLGRRMSSGGDFGGFFMWDSVFQSIWASRARERGYPILSSLDNFYMLQLEDGFIVREYSSRGLPCWNPDHPIALNPPILSWGEIEVFRHGVSDRARLERVYPKLVRFHESLKRRYRRADGLYFGEQLGCGMDDIVRSPAGMSEEDKKKGGIVFSEKAFGPGLMIPSLDGFRAHWLKTRSGDSSWNRQMGWIDITSQVALDCLNLAEIATVIGKDGDAKAWRAEHAEIAKAVNELCWDEGRGYYFDRGPDGIIPRYHGGSFWTMIARIPTPERAKRMVRAFEDPEIFGTPVPFPALAKCEPDYDSENHYWRGQVWPPTAYVAIIGLRTLGFEDMAQKLGRRYYNATYELWKATGTIWENLSSQQCDHPKPHAGRDFCGWGALAPVALPDDLGWTKPSRAEVTFYSPTTVRVSKYAGSRRPAKSWPIVIAKPASDVRVRTNETERIISYETPALKVSVLKATGEVSFTRPSGEVIVTDRSVAQGDRAQAFVLRPQEAIYGFGDQQNERLNQRGIKSRLVPQNQGDGIPVFHSSEGYAVLWDNAGPVKVADEAEGLRFENESGEFVDYYLTVGNADERVAQIRALTGDVPMLPLWAYGFWQSRERYESQAQLLDVLKQYRHERIPLDGIILDWRYWGEDNARWNAMDFDPSTFPDPKKMTDEIHRLHARTLISMWPSFGPSTEGYSRFAEKNRLLPAVTWPDDGKVKLHDPFCEDSGDIYWKAFERVRRAGFDGWWLDATDMDIHRIAADGLDTVVSSGCQWRNVFAAYPLACTEGVWKRWRTEKRDRTVILTRGATAGQQRCGTSVWSGDVDSSWEALKYQIPGGLNYSLTGNPHFNCDLGGFFSGSWLEKGGVKNPEWRELYVRWMQLGTYLPMMRSHGTGVRREIFLYGDRGDPVRDALEAAVHRRYELMPYLYSVAAETSLSRGGLMRPLFADFSDDPDARDVAQEFLLGRELLIAPVISPNVKTWKVYLPQGCDWWDLESGKCLAGGQSVELPVTLASVPRFARAGAVLPIGPDVQWNGEKPWDDLEVRVYPGADGEFTLREDDFTTFAYERGERTAIRFKWHDDTSTLEILEREGSYPGMLARRRFRIVLPGGMKAAVGYEGKAVSVSFADFAFGGNPITAEGEFLSDPAPRVGPDGKLWIFGSRDVTTNVYCSHSNDSFETQDLRKWIAHRDIIRSKGPNPGVPFLDWELLAPDAIYANGKWNIFYCMFSPEHAEGVASSESAAGPFTGAREFPGCTQIDPSVFRDDDGKFYYTWGQFAMNMAELKPDLSGLVEGTVHTNVINEAKHHFHEGSQLTKRKGIYYLTFADISRNGRPTAIGYATSKKVYGPYTYRGVIIDNVGCDPESWNNHGGIVEYKGRWYVFYHRSTNGSRSMRKACVEPIEFDDRGLIREVKMTTNGVGGPLDPFLRTAARTACGLTGNVRVVTGNDGREGLGEIRDGDTAVWRYFDFARCAKTIEIEVCPLAGGRIEISDEKGAVLGSGKIPSGDGIRPAKISVPVIVQPAVGKTIRFTFKTEENRLFGSLRSFVFR